MRDPNRIPRILQKLEILWKKSPDMRLGQLIESATVFGGTKADTFNTEDEITEHGIEKLLEKLR